MKRLLLITGILLMATFVFGQTNTSEPPRDTIFKLGGQILPVDVTKVTSSYVSFVYPGEPEVFTIERKQIQKIVFKNGRIEEYNKPVFEMVEDYQWEAVWLTENKKDVVDLYRRGVVSAKSAASSRSPKAAKKSATIRMQKKAANMKGVVILITHKESTGGYGEYPGYFIKGIVYGLEPIDEEAEMEDTEDNPLKGGVVL
ncbi:MAG: hypothetical protein JXJ22_10395 [Bacteroidales bacterium]|nr:hypothetical protein [Bacteroidales bacterium]